MSGYTSTTDLTNNTNAAQLSYADNCTTTVGTGAVLGLVTSERLPPAAAGGTGYSTSTQHDCWLGVPTLFTDINDVKTKFVYEGTALPGLDKLKQTVRAFGTSIASTTNYSYGNSLPAVEVSVKSDLRTAEDNLLEKKTVFDGLGRATKDQVKNGSGWIYTHRVYDAANRVWKSSNPTSTGVCDETTPCSFTETAYDSAGRPLQVTAPDGAKTSISYSNNETTTIDPGLVSKRTVTDALGRLVQVIENPGGNQTVTKYHYDANGQLLTVCPDGGTLDSATGACTGSTRVRTFAYDWLGRLRTAANPESGTVTYTYDESPTSMNGAGQLTSRSQTRGVAAVETPYAAVTRYHYDQLGRMTAKAYSGEPGGFTTPAVTYSYDTHNPVIPNVTSFSKGRLTRTETGNTVRTVSSYDELGRVTRSMQKTLGVEYSFGTAESAGYTYLRNGALASMRMPSGRVVSFGYDDLGRANRVESGGKEIVKSVTYEDHGGMKEIRKNGNVLRETFGYSAGRLQLTGITVAQCTDGAPCAAPSNLLELGFTYQTTASGGNGSGPNNNGNMYSQRINVAGGYDVKQSYAYDAWNRLEMFSEGPFAGGTLALNERYCHDAHGNHAVEARAGVAAGVLVASPCTAAAVSAVFPLNRINLSSYDVAGGLAADHRSNMRYDAEDRLAKTWPLTPAGAAVTTYEYDAEGRRVALKAPGGVTTTFVYDAFGKLTAEYGGVAAGTAGLLFFSQDHLGSTRLVTDAAGSPVRRLDYWPFGMEVFETDTAYRTAALGFGAGRDPVVRFTGKERDAETGLDYFGARYMSAAQGRFTSPDPLLAAGEVANPQSWNKYAYAFNNPLRFIDPAGLWNWDASAGGSSTDEELESRRKDKNLSRADRRAAGRALTFRNNFRSARDAAESAANASGDASAQASVAAWGSENDQNNVMVGVAASDVRGSSARVRLDTSTDTIFANFNPGLSGNFLSVTIGHEGRHVGDANGWLGTHCSGCATDLNHLAREERGWYVGGVLGQFLNMKSVAPVGGGREYQVWNRGWLKADQATIDGNRNAGIQRIMKYSQPSQTDTYSTEHTHRP